MGQIYLKSRHEQGIPTLRGSGGFLTNFSLGDQRVFDFSMTQCKK